MVNILTKKKGNALYLAIDQGGHASRALVFDARGQCVALHEEPIQTYHPQVDRVEHDADELVQSIKRACLAACDQLGDEAKNIQAAGLATQRSSMVCWRRDTLEALTPVISWQDTRAGDILHDALDDIQDVHHRSGLFPNAHYGASKYRWCLDNVDSVRHAADKQQLLIGPLSSYLLARLLCEQPAVVDPANAQRSLLMNVQNGQWDAHLLKLFGLDEAMLPRIVDSCWAYGYLDLPDLRIPLTICTGDQSAAVFARGVPEKDAFYINVGTGAFVQTLVENLKIPEGSRLLWSVIYRELGKSIHVCEGTVNGAGKALDWFAEQYAEFKPQADMDDALKYSISPSLFLNGVSGVGSPYWLTTLASKFLNGGSMLDKAAGVAESIVFLLYRNMELMQQLDPVHKIYLSGGLSRSAEFCKRIADISNLPVHQVEQHEATASGLAYLLASMPAQWDEGKTTAYQPKTDAKIKQRFLQWSQKMESISHSS